MDVFIIEIFFQYKEAASADLTELHNRLLFDNDNMTSDECKAAISKTQQLRHDFIQSQSEFSVAWRSVQYLRNDEYVFSYLIFKGAYQWTN